MSAISVFCGSNSGNNPLYAEEALKLGHFFGENQIKLIYGGAKVGLMGILANAVLEKGGEVIGIIPELLSSKELIHENLTELIVVTDMHKRKRMMYDLSQGSITLPGGIGSLDELMEYLTWSQIGLHPFPIAILNINHYYENLIAQLKHMVKEGFLNQEILRDLIIEKEIPKLIKEMKNFKSRPAPKWLKNDKN